MAVKLHRPGKTARSTTRPCSRHTLTMDQRNLLHTSIRLIVRTLQTAQVLLMNGQESGSNAYVSSSEMLRPCRKTTIVKQRPSSSSSSNNSNNSFSYSSSNRVLQQQTCKPRRIPRLTSLLQCRCHLLSRRRRRILQRHRGQVISSK